MSSISGAVMFALGLIPARDLLHPGCNNSNPWGWCSVLSSKKDNTKNWGIFPEPTIQERCG